MHKLCDVLKGLSNMPAGIELYVYLDNIDGRSITLWCDPAYLETISVNYRVDGKETQRFTIDFNPEWIDTVLGKLGLPGDSDGWSISTGTFNSLRYWASKFDDLYIKWEAFK